MSRRLLRCGEHAVLAEVDSLEEVLALDDAVRAAIDSGDGAFAEVVDVVPAARTLLLVIGEDASLTPVRDALTRLYSRALASGTAGSSTAGSSTAGSSTAGSSTAGSSTAGSTTKTLGGGDSRVVEIVVHYDGPDLQEVAELTGMSADEVVSAHCGAAWRVAFAGFAPGFAYLTGGDTRLQVPRRREPRTAVPAGSVAIAGEFSAVYPRSSPGGWQLLGHTDAVMWDVDRQPPALLQPGAVVRFVDAASR
jgi:KipI family sensor histidine kinase inhibitor